MRWPNCVTVGFGLAALLLLGGCEQKVPKEELGTIIYEVPKVPGSEQPFKIPQLEGAAKESKPEVGPKHP